MKATSIIALFVILLGLQPLNAKTIDTTAVVSIGGVRQFISIKAKDESNPIVLYLHGGPGAAVSSHREQVTGDLENHFVVIHWDQRGSGKTQELNNDFSPPTMDVMKQDAEEMLLYILKRFNREQVIVLGNSWGTVLGFHLAEKHPKKVQAFVAVSPIVNHKKSQELTLETLKRHFKEIQNEKALSQLDAVRIPIENAEQMLILHRWETVFNGGKFPDEQFEQYLGYFEQWETMWMPLYIEFYTLDLTTQIPQIDCSLFILQGDKDLTAHYDFAETFFEKVNASKKELLWLENTGHNVPGTASEKMQQLILNALNK